MASYAICHLKLELLLRQTGYDAQHLSRRFNVFLANSLEDADPATGTLFASWLSREAREANRVKRDSPVMVVIGNPPYAVSSSNRSDWIQTLIADYKKNLNERKINLDDDYIKFIRMGQHYVEKNGQGILAYISNNSFIDGITHRQMRRSLMEAFDDIYILDLHGSAKKKETSPDGSKDENVFDITQGVSINIFVKTGKKAQGQLAGVHHHELYGLREIKYGVLETAGFSALPWRKLQSAEPNLFFVPKDFSEQGRYEKGLKVNELFCNNNTGIQTKRDNLTIQFTEAELNQVHQDMLGLEPSVIKTKYDLPEDGRDWKIDLAIEDIRTYAPLHIDILYRPFDIRKTLYTGRTKGFLAYPRSSTMQHMLQGDNTGLVLMRINGECDKYVVLISNTIIEKGSLATANYSLFPLYLYSDDGASRSPNLAPALVEKIATGMGLKFVPEATGEDGTFAPLDLLDYIYAVLHTPSYREKYKEFLKIDFPRVPYPADAAQFRKLAAIGAELRALHLMESPRLDNPPYTFPVAGDNTVLKPAFKDGNVWINKTQYVGNVPKEVWEFYIGGYQPAQKWLKDRKGRALSYDDIRHYQKILAALAETCRLMAVLDGMAKDWMLVR